MAHAYLQRFAVDILSVLEPDQGGKLGERLVSVSIEPTRHDLIALYSVSKLASARNLGSAAEDPSPVLDQWTARRGQARVSVNSGVLPSPKMTYLWV